MNAPVDESAPRWLLPLVVVLHAGVAVTLAWSAAPLVRPTLQALEISLLTPPAPAPAAPAPAAAPTKRPQAPSTPLAATAAEPAPQANPERTATEAPAPAPAEAARTAVASGPTVEAPPAVTPPRFDAAYLDNPRPPYPPVARRLGEEGRTVLRVLVSEAGLPEQVELHESAGSPRLDEAALAAVRRWRFVPARQGGRAIAAPVLVPLIFKLEN